MFYKIADHQNPQSLAIRFRRRRMQLFLSRIAHLKKPIRILDVGGTEWFWQKAGLNASSGFEITLLNLHPEAVSQAGISSVTGDARAMVVFPDASFDVVFSNSVIEHLGTYEDQLRMANEIRRIAKFYFVQTPNRYFPVEPHFWFPFFQFLPLSARIALVRHFAMGYHERMPEREKARAAVEEIRLLNGREMAQLFPGCTLFTEKFLGLTKSLIAYGGRDQTCEKEMAVK